MRQRIGLVGLPDSALALSFPTRLRGLPTASVCRLLSRPTHPLVRFRSPSESLEPPPAPELCPEHPSLGFPPSSRRQSAESTYRGHPKPATFRPRRFSRPRRFPPPPTLRVYFTPQPRPGFALQGFPPSRSRTGSSPAAALLSFTRWPYSQFDPLAPGQRARLQGFALLVGPWRHETG